MKTQIISFAVPSKAKWLVCAVLLAVAFFVAPLKAFDDSNFVWKKLFYRKPGDACGFDYAYLSNTDSIFALPDLRCIHLIKTLSGEVLFTSSERLGWQNPRGIKFFDNDRYFVARRQDLSYGLYLYETQRVLNGDLTPLDTIKVEGVEIQDYDVSPGGKYLLLSGYLYTYLFELPTGEYITQFGIPKWGRRQIRFLNDDTLIIAVENGTTEGYIGYPNPWREYWIVVYDINKGEVTDTIYSKYRDCPTNPDKPWVPVSCTPLGPVCEQYWYGWSYCVPMFTVSQTGRYVLYGYVPQEYIDSNVFLPPLWWALYDVWEKKVLWSKEYEKPASYMDFGIFKFAANDRIILLHATHIIDARTGEVVYVWGKEKNRWIELKQHYPDITKDGKYIIGWYRGDDEAFVYLRRNPYVWWISEANELPSEGDGTIIPNPVDGMATLRIDGIVSGKVKITINTLQGEEIRIIYDGILPEGIHLFEIDTKELAGGIYFVVVQSPNWRKTYKLIVTK